MSQLEVDKIVPQSGTTLTIGDSGDTINFADGQNINIDSNTLYIDSTNNRVGIGTTSPTQKLYVNGHIVGNSLNIPSNTSSPPSGVTIHKPANDTMAFRINSTEKMRLTSTGLGIGTSSPLNELDVNGSIRISLDGGVLGNGDEKIKFDATGQTLQFQTADTEAMRIDSSGNLLVATTNSIPGVGNTDTGISLRNNNGGSLAVSRSGDRAGYFNRNTSDGDIVQFRKDGTAVGSIGIVNTNNLFIQGDSTNSGLQCGTNTILPVQNGANASNTIDMGDGANLWKDIYLGGGLYVGGTGTANKLDDYEEGTWTPTSFSSGYTASSASGTYTKIGDTVFIRALLNFSAVNGSSNSKCNFDGLPFSASDPTSGVSREDSVTGAIFVVRLGSGTGGEINSMDGISNGSNSVLATGRNYRISGFYKV
jgi:hypothetical protein